MKKVVKIIFPLLILVLVIIVLIGKREYKQSYVIDQFNIVESIKEDSYLFSINNDNNYFEFEIDSTLYNKEKIELIEYYYGTYYECVLPIFKDGKILVDFICSDNSNNYFYHSIKDFDEELDKFIESLNIKGYDPNKFIDNSNSEQYDNIKYYPNNMIDNHYMGVSDYKGLYILNNDNIKFVKLFDNDVYNNTVKAFINNNYIVADYNSSYDFKQFLVVNLLNGEVSTNKNIYEISLDSFLQGIVDSKMYLFDFDHKKQYEIDNNSIKKLSKFKYFDSGDWEYLSYSEISKKMHFNYENDYSFDQDNQKYNVYKNYDNSQLFLFATNDIENIAYFNSYIYFIDNSCISYVSSTIGLRKLYCNDEFKFNKTLGFGVYEKS